MNLPEASEGPEDKVTRYDYHLSKIIGRMVHEYDGEASLILDEDVEAAKVIARKCCQKENE